MDVANALLESARPAGSALPPWLRQQREDARASFVALGLPTTRHEEWKYTNVAGIARLPLQPAPVTKPAAVPASLGGTRLAFVHGAWEQGLSTVSASDAVRVEPLSRTLAQNSSLLEGRWGTLADAAKHAFVAWNTASFADGAVVHVPRGVHLEAPVELLFLAGGDVAYVQHPRVFIVLDEDSSATVVERYQGLDGTSYVTNAVTEIFLAPGASLRHVKVQCEGHEAYHVGSIHVAQESSSRFASHSVALGGLVARTDVDVRLSGVDALCELDGLYVARGRQLVDHHTSVDHRVANCTSRELYKGVLDDAATGVFNGKVFVRPAAQKSDAQQLNKNLLLSDAATIDTKPQLEILADDVKCSHGATIGRIDPAAHFYLRSRGMDAATARQMLIVAFANEMIGRLPLEALRADLEQRLAEYFHQPVGQGAD